MKMVDRDEFHRGAMRQKMAMFKEGNSVCRGTKNIEWRNFHEFHWGRCDRKWRFSNEETAFGGIHNVLNDIFFNGGDVDENRHFIGRKLKLVAHYQNVNIFQWGRC